MTSKKSLAWCAVLAAVLAIAYATLRPMPADAYDALPIFCFGCGDLGGLDVVLNVVLFIPLGAALVAAGWSVRRAALACFLFSLCVESLQFRIVTGRDTSLSDLTTNSFGGFLGAWLAMSWRWWLLPTARVARRFTLVAAAAALAVLALTVAALRPTVPEPPYYGQYAPLRLTEVQFDGVVHSLTVGGVDIPYSIVDSAEALRDSLTRGRVWARADITTRSFPGRRSDIVRVGARPEGIVALSQRQHDLLYRTRLRASDWKLRVPTVVMRGAFPKRSQRYIIEGALGERGWHMQSRAPDALREFDVPFSALIGWSFFLPFEFPLDERRPFLNALWGAALMLPVGYFLAWAVRGARDGRRRAARVLSWGTVPALLITTVSVILPRFAGFEPAVTVETLGVTSGLVLGILLAACVQWAAGVLESRSSEKSMPNELQHLSSAHSSRSVDWPA
ncbi:MAG: VanZ family protein [Gemmatimonadaceae bacterium]